MGIADFFRRKWKHSNPDVRAEAVRDLDDIAILAQIVRQDEDVRVRRIALKKIVDEAVLSEVAARSDIARRIHASYTGFRERNAAWSKISLRAVLEARDG